MILFVLSFIIRSISSLRPVVIVPPLFGSKLYINATNFPSSHWYCSKNQVNRVMWIADEYLIPPMYNCLSEYLTSQWDPSKNTLANQTNVEVFTVDFGGESSIDYVDSGIFGYHLIADMTHLLEKLKKVGYQVKKDLFGAPYDWRNSPHFIDHYYGALKTLIEEAYVMNDNQKVAVFSYSCGSMVLHYFLTKMVDQTWKDKYVQKAIWASPSFGGSIDAVRASYSHIIEYLPSILISESVEDFVMSCAILGAHLPNPHVFPDYPLVYGPNGQEYKAKDIYDWLFFLGKIPQKFVPIFEAGKSVFDAPLEDPGVNSYFAFNTGLKTIKYLNFSNGYTKEPIEATESGDGTMLADVLYYGCDKWASGDQGKTMLCHDFNTTNEDYSHVSILSTPEFNDVMLDIIMMDNWVVPGRYNVTGYQAPNLI